MRGILIAVGVVLIILACVILGVSLWESFGASKGKVHQVNAPDFHELDLQQGGLYGAVYQHRTPGPMPIEALTHLKAQLLFRETFEQIPLTFNTAGQTFERLGVRGMPLFNFFIHEPGFYTLHLFYEGERQGPSVPIFIISEAAQDVKQTLIVGGGFFILFLVLGILILVNLGKWIPKSPVKGFSILSIVWAFARCF